MLSPNTLLQNRYQILRLLGQGGMGAVYLAFDHRLNQNVALKENTGGDTRQFQREAQLLARLRHNNLPRVIDHFIEPNGSQYLVMDYIEGDDLETLRQQRGALPEVQVRAWFEQILDAVAYLHNQGVIHRDIKPDNIKITPNGQAVLVDFGIAKIFQTGQFTRSSQKFGSPGYASPEHYKGGTNQQSDIYSLGATLYAVLTGGPPPDAQALELGTAILVPPRNIKPNLSPQMEELILRAMRVKPHQSFQSVVEMRPSLGALTATDPIPVVTPRNNSRMIVALGVAIVGVLMLFGIGGLLWAANNKPQPTATIEIALATQTYAPSLIPSKTMIVSPSVTSSSLSSTTFTMTWTRTVTSTPTRTFTFATTNTILATPTLIRMVSSTPTKIKSPATQSSSTKRLDKYTDGNSGFETVFITDLATTERKEVVGISNHNSSASWSSDGRRILISGGRPFSIMTVDAQTENRIELPTNYGYWAIPVNECCFVHYGVNGEAIWSADGKRIVAMLRYVNPVMQECLFVMNADGSGLRRLDNCEADDHPRFWSVDGKWMIAWSERGLGLYAYEIDGNRRVSLSDLGGIKLYDERYYPWKIVERPICTAPSFWDCN